MYFVPNRKRYKLDRRYDEGIFLGTSCSSNEHFIGRPDGAVTRARAVARVPLERRWNKHNLMSINGTPASPNPAGADDADLEALAEPHDDADHELRELFNREDADVRPTSAWYKPHRVERSDGVK